MGFKRLITILFDAVFHTVTPTGTAQYVDLWVHLSAKQDTSLIHTVTIPSALLPKGYRGLILRQMSGGREGGCSFVSV